MTEEEFNNLKDKGFNRVPVFRKKLADLDTPLSIYLKIANEPNTYLFESVIDGERFGRYSFIGLKSDYTFEVKGKKCNELFKNKIIKSVNKDDPLEWIKEITGRYKIAEPAGLPSFLGGFVGYFSYEIVRFIEPKVLHLNNKKDDVDILLMLSENIIIIDNLSGTAFIVSVVDTNTESGWNDAQKKLDQIERGLLLDIPKLNKINLSKIEFSNTVKKEEFESWVKKIKNYIESGDVMQVVISHEVTAHFDIEPIYFYRALRLTNPSPYMSFFNLGTAFIIASSPEILVRLKSGKVTVRPIAGTRRRGSSHEEDKKLENELLSDEKELAEHLMLIDLGRNDIGKIADIGSVELTEKMVVERYSHVMHIVSNVDCKKSKDFHAIDVLKACFPAGTVSGAPKIRAMQIIDELEKTARGVYAGAIGYISFNGDMDLAIAIRTATIINKVLSVRAGAGIVYDSVPEKEWEETVNKAKALINSAIIVSENFKGI